MKQVVYSTGSTPATYRAGIGRPIQVTNGGERQIFTPQRHGALAALTRLVLEADDTPDVLLTALEYSADLFGAKAAQLFVCGPNDIFYETHTLPRGASKGQATASLAGLEVTAGYVPPGAAFPAGPDHGAHVIPILDHGRMRGLIRIESDAGLEWPSDEAAATFSMIGDLVAVLLRRARLAGYDPLTGLPTDRQFDSAPSPVATAAGAVLMVEIDHFRSIRTMLGRVVSDGLLCAFTDRLTQVLDAGATLARSDGDAFTIFLEDATPQAVEALAHKLHKAIRPPFALDQITVYATVSIGMSHTSAKATTAPRPIKALVRQAEVASFAARGAGGNRLALYTPAMDADLTRRSAIVQAMREALHSGHFTLAFQPKFTLMPDPAQAPRLNGTEALLRWNAPTLGAVSPQEFIPIAEAAGLISEIDFYVMGVFARQLGRWRAQGHDLPASINLSPRSFEDETLAPRLLELLNREGVSAKGITVEITETALISMSPDSLANIDRLRRAGITLSVDDFGTGFSSLGYLQKLIVSELKIDRSFIQGLPAAGSGTETIVRTVLALARSLGIDVVAEGVETVAQMAWLRHEGCHTIQGFLSGHAVCPDVFERTYLCG